MAKTIKRKGFSPIFTATVTFGDTVTVSDTKDGTVYASSPKASVLMPNGDTLSRTVMAFGNQLLKVQPDFAPGSTARLAIQRNGGSMKVIGYPLDEQPAADRDAVLEELANAA
jgi:hypothetical protein